MGLRGAICGGDRSWDTWGSLLRNSSADFLRTHGHRRGFDEKVAPDFEGSKGSEGSEDSEGSHGPQMSQ